MATRLRKLRITKVALVSQGANPQADVLLFKAAPTKRENDMDFPAAAFAFVPDAESPTTWKLRLVERPNGEPTAAQVGRAVAALGPAGFRGNRVAIPAEDMPGVKQKVLAAWRATHPDATDEDIPMVLKGDRVQKDMHHEPYTLEEKLARDAAYDAWCKIWWAFRDATESIAEYADAETKGTMFMQSVAEFVARARPLIDKMGMNEAEAVQAVYLAAAAVEKAGRVMAAERVKKLQNAVAILHAILAEAMGSEEEPAMKGARMTNTPDEMVVKRAETAEARVAVLETELGTVRKELVALQESLKPLPTEEEFLKTLPESLRQKWADNERRLQEAEAVAKAEKAQREQQEYIQKTASYRAVGLAPDDWDVLKAIDGLEEKSRIRLLQLLKSADAVIKQSALLTELGATGSGADAGTAYAAIEALATELMKSGTITKEQAIVKALDVRPDLARQYRAERKEALNGR